MVEKDKQVLGIFAIELIIAFLFVLQFFNIVRLNYFTHTFSLSQNFFDLIILTLLALLLLIVFGIQRKKVHESYLIQLGANTLINETAKAKLKEAKQDPRLPALILLEFAFVVMMVAAIVAYFDPDWVIINWQSIGIQAPLTTILNAVIGIAVIALFLFMYNFTKQYREVMRPESRAQRVDERIIKKIKREKPVKQSKKIQYEDEVEEGLEEEKKIQEEGSVEEYPEEEYLDEEEEIEEEKKIKD